MACSEQTSHRTNPPPADYRIGGVLLLTALLFLLGACTDYERAGVNPRPFNEPAGWETNPYGNAFRN